MANSRMRTWFPTTSHPLIVSAPMAGVANAHLATEVTKAGGFGFIQGGRDFAAGASALKKLDEELTWARQALSWKTSTTSPLPIGVGFVTYPASIAQFNETTAPIIRSHQPAAVWFFAPSPSEPDSLANVIKSLRPVGDHWGLKIIVQVGNVAAARRAVSDGADLVVAQGVDAGGHQWATGAGIISLVPEIADMLAEEFPGREVGLWAAGGIADGRSVASSIALGAEGAVVGTGFMVATESSAPDYKRQVLLDTSDGGASTVKSQLHDHIQGNMDWPDVYDGRAVVHPSYTDHKDGVSLEENTKRFNAARDTGDLSRMVTWSGTGVGLIRESQPAGEIVRQLKEGALKVIGSMKSES